MWRWRSYAPKRGRWDERDRLAPEDAPVRDAMGRGRRSKGFNENLAPLRRYLLAQVGRRWDAVHAEICAHIKLSSTVQRHVLQHLREMVILEVEMVGKQPRSRRTGRAIWAASGAWRDLVYVDPASGLLRRTPARPRPRALAETDRVLLVGGDQLQRIRGVWYHVTMLPIPEKRAGLWVFDAVLGLRLDRYWAIKPELAAQHGRDDIYAAALRPVGDRAVRRLLPEDRR